MKDKLVQTRKKVAEHDLAAHTKLSELPATAICGNDISSSCLYVSALSIAAAGQFAWISLLIVAVVLFLFRKIYGEVVGALPLNGGAYNALLNTTSKRVASLAACLTLLSYMATAVISGLEAMHYVQFLWEGLPLIPATIALLAVFMLLTIMGIGESAMVAVGIFIFHLFALTLLVGACGYWLVVHADSGSFSVFTENWHTQWAPEHNPGSKIALALFFGFSAAMLGISGFESSSNFVEEQAEGVFRKTLKNMWIVVSVFNPLLAFLALTLLPIQEVVDNQNSLLAHLGTTAVGHEWLGIFISVDAALVLSGAVLTSFVGVAGLVQRMTLDRIMPQFFLKLNKRGSAYWIMIAFFLLCVVILLVTVDLNVLMGHAAHAAEGELSQLEKLAGIYTISFLSVMALFGIGNILLKVRRAKLPRPERASYIAVFIGILGVVAALVGQILMDSSLVKYFLMFFLPTMGVVLFMLYRIPIMTGILNLLRYINVSIQRFSNSGNDRINKFIDDIKSQEFVFFTKGDNVATLNRVMQYIEDNENTKKIKIVTVLDKDGEILPGLMSDIEVLDRTYPDIDIEFISMQGSFGPELIEKLSTDWNIPKNFMFIGSPSDKFPYRIEDLGGVRLII